MRIKGLIEGAVDHQGGGAAAIGGVGETHIEVRRRILNTREMKLKRMLEKLRNQRILLRNKRQKLEYPVIAVVGYTNSGKALINKYYFIIQSSFLNMRYHSVLKFYKLAELIVG
jgi:50S ribosomal subunit-associated GTPase HflX